jgi:hypothetical protein
MAKYFQMFLTNVAPLEWELKLVLSNKMRTTIWITAVKEWSITNKIQLSC